MEGVEYLEIGAGQFRFSARAAGPVDGRLVVLLHGFPQDSRCWEPVMRRLAQAPCRAVAVDQRGYSPGARPEGVEHYGIDRLVSDVIAVADEMGGHQFDIVGHDWGGVVAWHLAARYPTRLRTLTSVSTPHPRAFAEAIGHADQATRSAYIGFFRTPAVPETTLLAAGGAALRRMLTGSGLSDDVAARYVTAMSEPGALSAALAWYRANDLDAVGSAGPCSVSTLYVWGSADAALGRRAAEGTAQHVVGSYRFEPLEGVNHWVPETAPDLLSDLLLEHLATHG